MAEEKIFEILNKKDVSDHIEKKMNLSYLSWTWAHQKMKEFDENAKITVHEFPDVDFLAAVASSGSQITPDIIEASKINYKKDKGGAYVKVSVTIKGRTETEFLPVMDFKNKSMSNPDSMSVNKSLKRCFVKALALHGLGLYIYAGEDLPEKEKNDTPQYNQKNQQPNFLENADAVKERINNLARNTGKRYEEIFKYLIDKANERLNRNDKELNQTNISVMVALLKILEAKSNKPTQQQGSMLDPITKQPTGEINWGSAR